MNNDLHTTDSLPPTGASAEQADVQQPSVLGSFEQSKTSGLVPPAAHSGAGILEEEHAYLFGSSTSVFTVPPPLVSTRRDVDAIAAASSGTSRVFLPVSPAERTWPTPMSATELSGQAHPPSWTFGTDGDDQDQRVPSVANDDTSEHATSDPAMVHGLWNATSLDDTTMEGGEARLQPEAPYTPVEDEPLPHIRRTSSLGPVGKSRMPATVIIASLLTLGIYALVWHHKINREMGEFDAHMHVEPARSTWAVTIPWLCGVGLAAALGARIVIGATHISVPFTFGISMTDSIYALIAVALGIQYLELFFAPSVISMVMTAERIRIVQERGGLTSDRELHSVRIVWLMLIPLVGGLAMMAFEQSKLNAIWELVAPVNPRRTR